MQLSYRHAKRLKGAVARDGAVGWLRPPVVRSRTPMGITEPAKSKLLKKVRRLRRDFLGIMKRPRAP
jgi:hypothetical protein